MVKVDLREENKLRFISMSQKLKQQYLLVSISREIFLKYMYYTEKHIHVYMIFSTIRHLKFNTIVVYSERFFEKFFTKNMLSKFCIKNRIRLFNGNFQIYIDIIFNVISRTKCFHF